MTSAMVKERKAMLVGEVLKTTRYKREFYVSQITERGIVIRPESSNKDRLITWPEVELMGQQWENLKASRVTRSELANGTPAIFNTSYLASIFYAIEL